ncbi:MAG: MAPEG family protein [Pseudomonadales bacterium]|nr:MAPEG family protein [Pseudomonadales bacterium]
MTTDLWMLVSTALLSLSMPFIYGTGRSLQPGGFTWSAGNRETELVVPGWTRRAVQAHMNLIESIAPFAILVVVAHISGKANELTALGSTIFFCGRIAHLIVYVAGIVYLRTLAWFASWAGGILILIQLFK